MDTEVIREDLVKLQECIQLWRIAMEEAWNQVQIAPTKACESPYDHYLNRQARHPQSETRVHTNIIVGRVWMSSRTTSISMVEARVLT